MKDNVEDRLRVKVMPDLGKAIDTVDNTYKEFRNSQDKTKRTQLLKLLSKAAADARLDAKALLEMFGAQVFEGPMPGINKDLAKAIRKSTGDDIDTCYRTLTIICKNFVGVLTTQRALYPVEKTDAQKLEERIQLLFQMLITLDNLAELAQITDPEPQRQLVIN
jgi:hypothetical protein